MFIMHYTLSIILFITAVEDDVLHRWKVAIIDVHVATQKA